MKHWLFALTTFLLGNITLNAQVPYRYVQPVTQEDGWRVNHLKTIGADTNGIHQLFTQLNQAEHKVHSVLLVKDNELVLEEYFDQYQLDTPHDLRSVTKSIVALLLGIAIDKGFIESIDVPINDCLKTFAPQKNKDERKSQITIRHLLTMSPGWDCNDWDKRSKGQEDKVYKKKDLIQYTLDLPMVNNPGEVSNYCTMGVLLIKEAIAQASGMSIDQFANKYLFEPMHITNFHWGHTSGETMIPSSRRLYLTPRDMAKIGVLVLEDGKWKGEQLVSEKWIRTMSTSQTKITGVDYGMLWWNIPFANDGKKTTATVATGNGGQYILVFKAERMVAVFTGGAYNSQEDKLPFAITKDILLPLFTTE